MANLIVWRHAEAEAFISGGKDIDRALTKKGHQDATKMAKWLNQYLPSNTEIICSPARRCLETVAALQQLNQRQLSQDVKIADFLSVDSTVELMAKYLVNDDSNSTILLIGHQPNLGLLIAKLLSMNRNACVVKKGSVWWLRQKLIDGQLQTYLLTVQHPNYVLIN